MATDLRQAVIDYRRYLAGPCGVECMDLNGYSLDEMLDQPYDGHRHWTRWYEDNRSQVIALNFLLEGELDWPARLLATQPANPDDDYEN